LVAHSEHVAGKRQFSTKISMHSRRRAAKRKGKTQYAAICIPLAISRDGAHAWQRPRHCAVRAYDWTARLAAIAAAAELIKAKSFTIDGEAVVLGPDGLSRFEELSRREAARNAILYAFDLIEHDGEDLRNLPFLDRKAATCF
jgi:hypothetical protein